MHGMVLDPKGQKMSKSKGNVLNPMEAIEKFGSDALRMGVMSGQTAGHNQPYVEAKVIGGRNFANKLWNIARYIEDKVGTGHAARKDPKPVTPADHWLLAKLEQGIAQTAGALERYNFADAYETVYHLVWDDFADWYLEASKSGANDSILAYGLETLLTLAHPFAPFVTETIWQTMEWEGPQSLLITSRWPQPVKHDTDQAKVFEEIKSMVTEIRNISSALQLGEVTLYYDDAPFIASNAELLKQLAKLDEIKEVSAGRGLHLTQTSYRCWLDVDQVTARNYLGKLEAQRTERQESVKRLEGRLGNKAYTSKAPKAVVEQSKAQLQEEQRLLAKLETELANFQNATRDLTEGLDPHHQ